MKIKFYPSYSGLTFPLVISAMGLKLSTAYFAGLKMNVSVLKYIVGFETIIAVCIVAYVFIKYCQFIVNVTKKSIPESSK